MVHPIQIFPIGVVRKRKEKIWIDLYEKYSDGLLGLEGFSHVTVIYWFHRNDIPMYRSVLQVHPRRNKDNPLTGVFATHSPHRPNLIALTTCKIISVTDTRVFVEDIDAQDGSPVLDLKSYRPPSAAEWDARVPAWVD